ncbi:MAG: tRNA (guanosine(46)-N7)-methyltransferase TrmB [Clostridia bacterium]|nr:tRNA (guanosine(46)-N7)-methyltransferase TrmB [Clostridia bacterium]
MRQRNVKNCDEILDASDKYIKDISSLKELIKKNKYENIFLEIGIGKGAFIAECARRHKENLYIGIELNKGVVSLATKKIARFEQEIGETLENLKVLDYNALELENIFDESQVDKIYLNFSDPWPKKKHEKRRLTSDEFLKVYNKILKSNGIIEFKTDNRGLFEYSLMNMNKNHMRFEYISLNLHADIEAGKLNNEEPNIMTEYEAKFMVNGPIYKMKVSF